MIQGDPFNHWLEAAESRYLSDLTRPELGRALRALSSCYIERRNKLGSGQALDGRGKRAAFALYYGPLHFLTVREIARAVVHQRDPPSASARRAPTPSASARQAPTRPAFAFDFGAAGPDPTQPDRTGGAVVFDLGCGTGAAGAAWALVTGADVRGTDVNPWAVAEAAWTYRTLGVRGTARRGDVSDLRLPSQASTILAAFVINELAASDRAAALERLVEAAGKGHHVVVVEPISKKLTPWWGEWERAFQHSGARTSEWRFRVELPRLLRDLDKSAGLDHRELTARTLEAGGVSQFIMLGTN
jgi:predicted RNA methylase